MLTTRSLAVSAACAVLLGLLVSGLVRAHLSKLEAAAATERQALSAPSRAGHSLASPSEAVSAPEPSPAGTRTWARPRAPTAKVRSLQASPRKAAGTTAATAVGARAGAGFAQQLDHGIAQLGERRYQIRRSTLDLALGNLPLLSQSARVAPEVRAGRPFGFRLVTVAVDGPLGKLGLRDDDVLVSINGLALATVDQVLDAYGKLTKASHLVLGLVRDGHRTALEYFIR